MDAYDVDDSSLYSRRLVGGRSINTSEWATPDEGALEAGRQAQYFARKKAVSLFLSGASAETIRQLTGLGAKQAYRLIRERCMELHADGRPYGWRGLVPYLRMRPYKRTKKIHVDKFGSGAAGALQTVLDCHPDLRTAFDARIRRGISSKKLIETKLSKKRHHRWFLDELRLRGYEMRNEWPFTTDSQGYYSICRHVDHILSADPKALAGATGGPDLIAKLKTGDGTNRPVARFMQRVEMDAHKIDGRFCVSLPLMGGGFKEKIVHRLWVIVIIEVMSRAVVGYYFSIRREISKDDVLRAIKCALNPWVARQVSFCDAPYLPGAGLLSSAGSDFLRLCWDETSVDGALAETCHDVRNILLNAVGSVLLEPKNSFSIRRSKDDRPFIEAFFRNLAGGGFQRMSNTTGAKPKDRRGRKPEEVALLSRFQYEYAEELLDVIIANYNRTPHHGISDRTPLDYANFLYKNSEKNFRWADRETIENLFSVRKRCFVRGGAKTGRSPFVEFYYAKYSNETLINRQDLVGKEIWVICHKEDDCRVALGSTLDGVSLGVLRAFPPWHISPHSLSVRAAINHASARGKFDVRAGGDAVEAFMSYVESQPSNKLPVHPAYLEARRILVAATEQSIGTTMLESAMSRAQASDGPAAPQRAVRKESGHHGPYYGVAGDRKNGAAADSCLPPRRMAATR